MYEVHLKLRIAMFLVSSYFPHIINVGKVPRKSNIKGVRGGNFSQEFAERERVYKLGADLEVGGTSNR